LKMNRLNGDVDGLVGKREDRHNTWEGEEKWFKGRKKNKIAGGTRQKRIQN